MPEQLEENVPMSVRAVRLIAAIDGGKDLWYE